MAYYLAVDAGGTKTDYVLADEVRILARVRTPTIKLLRTDAGAAAEALDHGLQSLAAECGVPMSAIHRTCIGTAGETVPVVVNFLQQQFASRVGGELVIVGDVIIALDAAFQGGSGVLALAGTGSNVAGRTPRGQLVSAGGWGPSLADQGSGHRIGHEALRAIFLARDEDRPTLLLDAILNFWTLSSLESLIEYANHNPPPDFSRLCPLVLECARQGDSVAKAVLNRQGEELAHLVCLVIRKIRLAAGDHSDAPRLAFAGSILQNIPPVRDTLVASVRQICPDLEALDGVVDPLEGALWRARTGEPLALPVVQANDSAIEQSFL